jgi:predicted nucleic acid-binding protein
MPGTGERSVRIALTYDRSVYDCLCEALAIRSGWRMITADERLVNALATYLPVRGLGALQ